MRLNQVSRCNHLTRRLVFFADVDRLREQHVLMNEEEKPMLLRVIQDKLVIPSFP